MSDESADPNAAPSEPTLTEAPALSPSTSGAAPSPAERYVLGVEIARGGMGIVYRATDSAFDRPVAIKVLRHGGPQSELSRRFADEARITGQLQHPSIPPVHDLGTLPDGTPFLAMKLIKGDTLDHLLKDSSDPTARRGRLVAAFEQVCQAVAYAHDHRVIHRDLKPANVMVGAFGEVQVMDWGLAKVLDARETAGDPEATAAGTLVQGTADSDDQRTRDGSVLGTPAFMPPEQAIGALGKVNTRSDVFGLGGILTGQPPFASGSAETTRIQAAQGQVAECFARLDDSGADPALIALCKRCLSPDPAGRPADAGEVARAVAALRLEADERARQAELDRVRSEEGRKRRRMRLTLTAGAVCLLAAATFGATVAALWRSAERARDIAEIAQGDAEDARAETEAARERLARVEYGRTMQVAYREWLDNNAGATVALLASTRPDLRGWEYQYLHGLCHTNLLTLKGRFKNLYSAEFSPDGTRVVVVGWDYKRKVGMASVYDAKTGTELLNLEFLDTGAMGNRGVSFSSDGTRILFFTPNQARICNAKTGAEVMTRTFDAQKDPALDFTLVGFSADGSKLLTVKGNDQLQVWDARSGAELVTLEITKRPVPKKNTGEGFGFIPLQVSFSSDGSRILAGGWAMAHPGKPGHDGYMRMWDAKTGTALLNIEKNKGVSCASISSDGSRLVSISYPDEIQVWDAKSGAVVLTIKSHDHRVTSARFSRDGTRIVTAGLDGTARVWDAKKGAELLSFKGHTGELNSASFSPDGLRIVTVSRDGTARIWDAKKGAEVPPLVGNSSPVTAVSSSLDGSRVVTASSDGSVRVWDMETGATSRTWRFVKDRGQLMPFVMALSRDGAFFANSNGGKVQIWDAKTGSELLTPKMSSNGQGQRA